MDKKKTIHLTGKPHVLGSGRKPGYEIEGLCLKCSRRRICVLFRQIAAVPMNLFIGDFKLTVDVCKFYEQEGEDE